jgi:hypothetical protein
MKLIITLVAILIVTISLPLVICEINHDELVAEYVVFEQPTNIIKKVPKNLDN